MRVVDSIIALRIVYLLTVPFNKTDAYKLGLIDENGNKIKNAETSDEKNATSMLHRLVWNIKKVFALVPGGKTRIGSLVAAYMLVRESHEMKLSEEDSLKYFNENFDKVWNLPFEEREWVEDALTTLSEDAPANATGEGVSTNTPTVKRGRKFAEFQIDDDTFSKFKNGKSKYRRWATYLNLEDSTHKQIYEFATKNRTGIIVLKDSKGTLKGIRYSRKGSGNWANIKRKPQQIVESSLYTEIEIENIEL
jgi:hypothetical protein